ncbi:NAD-dependent epimerase/dehydratase family protein [Paenibacillus sp. NPDC057967]|uniref:NAD-dependent epimerase/dehydratase family protein n=1 Tax=Paenibacillus sp. NPDC057967 TaxID=3346293 RepID=UPI0036DE3A97
MKVLVTGGAGFIGSQIADSLIERGDQVIIVDNLSTGMLKHVSEHASFYNCDITSEQLSHVFELESPDYVIHHAAQIDVQKSMISPRDDANINIIGTLNVLENCKKYGVKKIVYASSAAVYGQPQSHSIDENHPIAPISNYGISKYVPEIYIKTYQQLCGLKFTILRYANVYGVRQSSKGEGGAVSIFMDRVMRNQAITVYGDGNQTRDFVNVSDIVQANLMSLTSGDNQTFNVSTNTSLSINELIVAIETVAGIKPVVLYENMRSGDIVHSRLDNHQIIKALGWQPRIPIKQGLQEIINLESNQNRVNSR